MVRAGANGVFVKSLLPKPRVRRSSDSSSGVIADTQIAFSDNVNDTTFIYNAFEGNDSIPSEPAQSTYIPIFNLADKILPKYTEN